MDDTYYDEWFLCGQDFVNWLRVKSQNSETTKSYQTVEARALSIPLGRRRRRGIDERKEWGIIYISWVPSPISRNKEKFLLP